MHERLSPETEKRVRNSIARQTMLTTLGVGIGAVHPGLVELTLARRTDLCQQHGYLHAGAISTLADSAAGYAALTLMPRTRDVLTIGFTINLIAPALQPEFLAVGEAVRVGRTISVATARVFGLEDGTRREVAVFQGTLIATDALSD